MKTTFKAPDPVGKTFTALPTAWLWPAGFPVWQISTLGAAVALTSVAVPVLPTVLPDKPPTTEAPAAAGAQPSDEDPEAPADNGPSGAADPTDPTAIPTVTAVTPTEVAGETPSEAPTATDGVPTPTDSSGPEATEAPDPTGTDSAPPADEPTDPGTIPDVPDVVQAVTIAASDALNKRWLVSSIDCGGCASGSRIIGLGLLATLTVPVNADSAGTRQLTIAYETVLQRDLYVSVNGGAAQKLTLAGTGGWDKPGWTSLSIDLKQGENSIKFSNPLGLAPDLDQITVN